MSVSAVDAESHVDFQKFLSIAWRRRRAMAAVAFAVLALVVVITFQTTPTYTAVARVMFDPRQEDVVNKVSAVLPNLPVETSVVDSEVEVLRSRSMAERVVDDQQLWKDPEFAGSFDEDTGGGLFGLFSAKPEARRAPPTAEETALLRKNAVTSVMSRVSARRVGFTYVMEITFDSEDPQKAARIANAYSRQYLQGQIEEKFNATQRANIFLNDRVAQLRQQVEDADAAVQNYRIQNNLMSAQGATLSEQEISNLDQQLVTARTQQAEVEARLSTARAQLARGSAGDDVGETMLSPTIQNLREQRATANQTLASLQQKYGDRHPEMEKARRQVASIDADIAVEIRRIMSNLEAQVQVARQRTATIAGSAGGAKGRLAGNNRAQVGLNELESRAQSIRTVYESFLNRLKETSAQAGLNRSDARIVALAIPPDYPSAPRKSLNIMIGMVLALGSAFGLAALLEAFDSSLGTADDVEKELETAYMGSIPQIEDKVRNRRRAPQMEPVEYVGEYALSPFAESFKSLRASLLTPSDLPSAKVIAFTSALPGEGKTTACLCMARTLALSGVRTVVVDCDVRQRGASRAEASDPDLGVVEVLNGTATLNEVMLSDALAPAKLLPMAWSVERDTQIFATQAFRSLLLRLRREYDIVILDAPPVLPTAEARDVALAADVVVLLARWRKTPRKAVETALKLLLATGAPVAGVVLSRVDLKEQARAGYGDPAYYYKSYSKYYTTRS